MFEDMPLNLFKVVQKDKVGETQYFVSCNNTDFHYGLVFLCVLGTFRHDLQRGGGAGGGGDGRNFAALIIRFHVYTIRRPN